MQHSALYTVLKPRCAFAESLPRFRALVSSGFREFPRISGRCSRTPTDPARSGSTSSTECTRGQDCRINPGRAEFASSATDRAESALCFYITGRSTPGLHDSRVCFCLAEFAFLLRDAAVGSSCLVQFGFTWSRVWRRSGVCKEVSASLSFGRGISG